MPNITILDQDTINQIAAGEVIERPSSVVKELLENAIDAGATAVTVEIKEGGISFIRITDNGCGIEKSQIPTAFLRHSTSKIQTAADLLTVSSLGFRGEALSSIAAVAQVELISKTAEELTGTRYQIHGGQEISLEEIGAPEGTTFLVRNLFYNTPARKKFLKSAQTEGAYISSLVERMALSRPDISIRFIQNGQNRLYTSGNHNLKDLIYMIFGRDIAANLLPVETAGEHLQITGFLGKPVISRGNRSYENYFINGRYIKSGLISKAIEDGFHSYMMQHKYPFTVLHLKIEPEFLDVNVHPSKMELRFRNQEEIYDTVKNAVRTALTETELIRNVSLGPEPTEKKAQPEKRKAPEPFEKKRIENMKASLKEASGAFPEKRGESRTVPGLSAAIPPVEPPVSMAKETGVYKTGKPVPEQAAQENEAGKQIPKQTAESHRQLELFEEKLLSRPARAEYQFIGQLFDTYWLIQYRDEFLIIDQHAAHEKILYERMLTQFRNNKILSQMIAPPVILTLNMREEQILRAYQERFQAMGFEIEPFGGKEYAIYSVPSNLYGLSQGELFTELLDSLSEDFSRESDEMILEKLASMSCKAAVKGGDRLSVKEAEALIDELLTLDNPYACPHGRPTIISMSRRELEKKFKRIV